MSTATDSDVEVSETFECFGSSCTVSVIGGGAEGSARDAVQAARRALNKWHRQPTFQDESWMPQRANQSHALESRFAFL